MSINSTDLNKVIKEVELLKKDFEPSDVCDDLEYEKYCTQYLGDAIDDLKGVKYYLDKYNLD